jgi:hypothetical protein
MLVGNVDRLHVRVDVDENDAWRMYGDAPAMAFVRGNRNLQTPLQFVRIEPYMGYVRDTGNFSANGRPSKKVYFAGQKMGIFKPL